MRFPFGDRFSANRFFSMHEEDSDMKRILLSMVLLAAIVGLTAPAASAQTTTDIKNGTVVSVGENMVVIRESNGQTREFDVPPDFTVTVDGKSTPLSGLKPGMKITAAVKTVNVPTAVQTTELKNAKVIKNAGGLLYVRESDGIHSYNIPAGFRFNVGGAKLRLEDLQQGQHLNATIVHTTKGTHTEQEVASLSASDDAGKAAAAKAAADKAAADKAAADKAAADAAARAAADRAAADKAAADAAAKAAADRAAAEAAAAKQASLPKTASSMPAVGALGVLCLGLGAALTLRRKLS
jgi:LPXTG-motif cell wall-anchored protein